MRARRARLRGVSLIEALIAGFLFAVVCAAILGVYRVGMTTESVAGQRAIMNDGLVTGIRALERDVAEASASLATSTSASVAVVIPIFDAKGSPTGLVDAVTFTASGSELFQTVVPGLRSSRVAYVNKRVLTRLPEPYPSPGLFTYWTRINGNLATAQPAGATIVRVTLLQTDTYGDRRQTVELSQDIRMRNR